MMEANSLPKENNIFTLKKENVELVNIKNQVTGNDLPKPSIGGRFSV